MTKDAYMVGVYGWLQLAMMDVELLNRNGRPKKKKHYEPQEEDALAIYKWVGEQVEHLEEHTLRKLASQSDHNVRKLLNDHTTVNNFMLGLMLLRAWVDEDAPKHIQLMIWPKIDRLMRYVDDAITSEEFDAQIRRTTARTADNLWRQYKGRAQLSDEVRDAKFKRIRRVT